jgi:biopolymer transport protein ExbB
MYPIALTALVGVAFIIERAASIRRAIAMPAGFREALLERIGSRDFDGAIALCERQPCSLGRVVRAALLRRFGTVQQMEKAAEDAGVHELWLLRRNVRPISVVAAIAPLLGLLGTVSGMIGAFETMSAKSTMGDPGAFAGAIREALFTTFFGLSVAIPMIPFYHWLHGKAQALVADIADITAGVLLELSDGLRQEKPVAGAADAADAAADEEPAVAPALQAATITPVIDAGPATEGAAD